MHSSLTSILDFLIPDVVLVRDIFFDFFKGCVTICEYSVAFLIGVGIITIGLYVRG